MDGRGIVSLGEIFVEYGVSVAEKHLRQVALHCVALDRGACHHSSMPAHFRTLVK